MTRAFDTSRDVSRRPIGQGDRAEWLYLLHWMTIPIEVLFRRRFGARWLTPTNFFIGLLVLVLFSALQYGVNWLTAYLVSVELLDGPLPTTQAEIAMANSLMYILVGYVVIALIHFYVMWWRKRVGTPLHTFEDGISWFEPLGKVLAFPLNLMAMPFIYLLRVFVPKDLRRHKTPKWIENTAAFTDILVEPLVLITLAFQFTEVASVWMVLSAIATSKHGWDKWVVRREIERNYSDSFVQIEYMRAFKDAYMRRRAYTPREKPTDSGWYHPPPPSSHSRNQTHDYGDIDDIINAYHRDKGKDRR